LLIATTMSLDRAYHTGDSLRRWIECVADLWHRCFNALMTELTVDELLGQAREGLERLSPAEAEAAAREGAVLIDIRADSQRAADGLVPGARFISRNVLEWRLDPACVHRDPELARRDLHLIVFCNQGYQSSL